ncbi:Mbov_0400 family ICE element protein [Mesomycoplasma ovipneumoniae]|uniref:Mbov_0400 family ICE element protein n=1 Tax=Mesomycoplasma ovipneumoniae TaxID=29562 RepID=UPI0030806C5F
MAIKDWIKLKRFSPFKPDQTVIFNTLGEPISSHPVIIFYDRDTKLYYYLKSRSVYDDKGRKRAAFPGEIEIPKSKTSKIYFTQDSYVDCSQIFYMSKDEMQQYIKTNKDKDNPWILKELDYQYVIKIFNQLIKQTKVDNPYIALSKVSYNEKTKKIASYVKYASDRYLNNDYLNPPEPRNKKRQKTVTQIMNIIKQNRKIHYIKTLEQIIRREKEEYNEVQIYTPLANWITELDKKYKWNSKEIIEYCNNLVEEFNKNKSIKYVVPATINWFTISKGMIINRKEDLLNKLEQRDFHFMLSWFKNNNLEPNLDSFEKFKEQMQIDAKGRKIKNWDYFNYLHLEQNLSKLEEKQKQKQTQNQKTIRNKVIHQNTGSTYEELAKQWEEEWLKEEEFKKDGPKMKM